MAKTLYEYLGRKPKIGYFCNYLNEVDGIRNHVKTMGKLDFDARIYIDGRFPDFPSPDNGSTDGSNDIIKTMKNSHLIEAGQVTEMEKNNLAFKKAAELGIDLLIQCDADEWIDFDRELLLESFAQEFESVSTFQFMVRFTNHWSSPPRIVNILPRLFLKPEYIESKKIHWWFYAFGNRIIVDQNSFIEGCHIHHDDRIRKVERNDLMDRYQTKNMRREQALINQELNLNKVAILDHKCFFDFKHEGGTKCVVCNRDK